MTAPTVGHGGTRVIALHGWFGTGQSWLPTLRWLNPADYTWALPDYRGYGTRIGDAGDYTIHEVASDALGLADDLGWDTFDLVGHSMGGKVAQLVAASAPTRVRRVVAVTPVPPGPLPFDDDARRLFRRAATDMANRAQIVAASTGHRHSRGFVDAVVAESRQSRAEAFGRYFESWSGDDITDLVAGLKVQLHVVVGEHDNALTAETMRAALLPHYPNSGMQELAGAGHYPIYETPVALATAIDGFLSPSSQEM